MATFTSLTQASEDNTTLGKLKNQLQVYNSHDIPLAIQETLKGTHAGVAHDISLLSIMHDSFSKVS